MAVQLAKLQRDQDPRQGPLYKPTPQPMAPQEKSAAQQMTDMVANKAMSETVDYGATKLNESVIQPGLEKASAMFAPAATAPTMSSVATPLMQAGVDAGLSNALAGQTVASGTAAGTGAAAAGTGALTALGTAVPYIGAAMLAGKAFGLFNKGGYVGPLHASMGGLMPMLMDKAKEEGIPMGLASMLSKGGRAGPLYASEGRKAVEGESIRDQLEPLLMDKFIEEQDKIQNEIEQSRYKYGGGMAGPLSKVEYKSAGGETYKLSYGGPISKGV